MKDFYLGVGVSAPGDSLIIAPVTDGRRFFPHDMLLACFIDMGVTDASEMLGTMTLTILRIYRPGPFDGRMLADKEKTWPIKMEAPDKATHDGTTSGAVLAIGVSDDSQALVIEAREAHPAARDDACASLARSVLPLSALGEIGHVRAPRVVGELMLGMLATLHPEAFRWLRVSEEAQRLRRTGAAAPARPFKIATMKDDYISVGIGVRADTLVVAPVNAQGKRFSPADLWLGRFAELGMATTSEILGTTILTILPIYHPGPFGGRMLANDRKVWPKQDRPDPPQDGAIGGASLAVGVSDDDQAIVIEGRDTTGADGTCQTISQLRLAFSALEAAGPERAPQEVGKWILCTLAILHPEAIRGIMVSAGK